MRTFASSTVRAALIASVVAWALLTPRAVRAETTNTSGETPPPSDTSSAGKSAPPTPFGAKGTRALGFVVDLGAANSGLASRPLGLGFRTTLDSFVVDHLSIGGQFGFEYADVDGSFYNVGGGARLGYALPLGDKLALWPMVVLTYDAGTVPVPPATGTSSLQDVRAGAQLPLVMMLGGQVAFELGPVASTDLWRSVGGQDAAHVDLIGLRTGIVGWF
ncbi:MAG TPA: hypothetical protein VGL81_10335 [Polyangiaceae bacterium]|jgi:hypothetical protein